MVIDCQTEEIARPIILSGGEVPKDDLRKDCSALSNKSRQVTLFHWSVHIDIYFFLLKLSQ